MTSNPEGASVNGSQSPIILLRQAMADLPPEVIYEILEDAARLFVGELGYSSALRAIEQAHKEIQKKELERIPSENGLMTLKQVTERYGIPRSTVGYWLDAGLLTVKANQKGPGRGGIRRSIAKPT